MITKTAKFMINALSPNNMQLGIFDINEMTIKEKRETYSKFIEKHNLLFKEKEILQEKCRQLSITINYFKENIEREALDDLYKKYDTAKYRHLAKESISIYNNKQLIKDYAEVCELFGYDNKYLTIEQEQELDDFYKIAHNLLYY